VQPVTLLAYASTAADRILHDCVLLHFFCLRCSEKTAGAQLSINAALNKH
jgi:hypothetical protein